MTYLAKKQSGLSLIELMIAMTLGLMVTVSLGYILMGSRSTFRTQDASARVQDTGRFAMEFIGRQLRSAGRIDISPRVNDPRTHQANLPAGWMPINGENAKNEVAIGEKKRKTDTVSIQYQLTDFSIDDKDDDTDVVVDCNNSDVPLENLPGGGVYGTAINTISLDGAALELECTGNDGGTQPFTENVEDFQVRYAELGTPNVFNATPANFANVVAVEVCIMVRSAENGIVTAPQSIVDCSGATYTPDDTRLRRTFTSVYTLRNRVNSLPE